MSFDLKQFRLPEVLFGKRAAWSLRGQPDLPSRVQDPPRTPPEAEARAAHSRSINEVLLGTDYLRYEVPLTERDRHVLGGLVFPGAQVFVAHAARGILENAHLYTAEQVARARLFAARQREADAHFDLRNTLGVMLAVVCDNYQEAQGTAIRDALEVVREIEGEFVWRQCDPRSEAAARVDGVYEALLLLRDYRDRIAGRRDRRPKSATAKRREAAQRRAMWGTFLRGFQRLLRTGRP